MRLREENKKYKASTRELDDIINNLRQDINTKYSNYDELVAQIDSFKGIEGINQQLQSDLEEAKRTISSLEKKQSKNASSDEIIANLEQANASIREELEMKKKSSKGTIDNLNNKIEGLKRNNIELETINTEYKTNMEGYTTKIAELSEQIEQLRTNTDNQVIQSTKLSQENEAYQAQITNLKVEYF